jgi:ribosomal-protein-alanine N-acetyltransferase
MPTRKNAATLDGTRVYLRPPRTSDARTFIAAARASRQMHGAWTHAPDTPARFTAYLARVASPGEAPRYASFLVFRREDDALAGVFNFSEILRGAFQSAHLGYSAFAPHHGQGYMTEGMALALDAAFGPLALHRVEANIQPTNARSLALVERLGFTREGYARRYVKIGARWRDHLRYAMLAEDWRLLRRRHFPPRHFPPPAARP